MIHERWLPPAIRRASEEDKEKYRMMIRGSADGLRRLKEIITDELKDLQSTKSLDDYAPGWEFKQADRLGQIRAFNKLMTFLEFINHDTRQ